MPTANRRQFVPWAIGYFLRQDYEPKELVIVDDGTDYINDIVPVDSRIRYFRKDKRLSVGAKRNFACEQARGEIIVHWDDDDWMAHWRLTYQVEHLLNSHADVCGLDALYFYNSVSGEAWKYVYPKENRPWLAGGTLCYRKTFWEKNPFPAIDVGEDARFARSGTPKKLVALPNPDFYVALVHPGNTSPKHTQNRMWRPISVDIVKSLMGKEYALAAHPEETHAQPSGSPTGRMDPAFIPSGKTLVTCLMATRNRRAFIEKAIEYFLNQDYPAKELLILDDGSDPIADLIPKREDIVYMRLDHAVSLGEKRNLGVEAGRGEIIILWDDDDWYSSRRLSYQVEPIIRGRADATVLQDALMFDLSDGKFWICDDGLRDKMFAYGVIGGTVAFRKNLFNGTVRFPKANLAEDAGFLGRLFESKAAVQKLSCNDSFIYIRHGRNTWSFTPGSAPVAKGWRCVDPPPFLSPQDFTFYRSLSQNGSLQGKAGVIDGIKAARGSRGRKESAEVPLSERGAHLYRRGAFEEALDCLERAAWIDGGDPWIMFDMGLCLLSLHKPAEALGKFQAAQSRIKSNTWVYSALGKTLARLGRYSAAREAFESARRLDPRNNEAAMYLDGSAEKDLADGLRRRRAGNIPEAIALLDAAIMKDRKCLRALEEKADTLRVLGKVSEAFPYLIASMGIRADGQVAEEVAAAALRDAGHSDLAEQFSSGTATFEKGGHDIQVQGNSGFPAGLPNTASFARKADDGICGLVRQLDTGEGSLLEDYLFLYALARLLKPRKILEVGTNTGVSSIVFAEAMRESRILGTITTIDADRNVLKKARSQIERVNVGRYIDIVEGDSRGVLPGILEKKSPFDLCFLDGDHGFDTIRTELELVRHHCRYILLHDSSLFEGVRRLLKEVRKSPDLHLVKLEYPPGEQWSEGRIKQRSSPGFALIETHPDDTETP